MKVKVLQDMVCAVAAVRDMVMCVTANRHGKCECHINQISNGKKLTEMALDLKTQLLNEYRDIISDTLPEKPACGKPMKIHLKAGTITLKKILTALKVLLHWEEPARWVIDKALAYGIITKVEGLTDWISPAFYVDKNVAGEICLHLVTDFSGLNKYVLWPVHPFLSSQEIISSLNPRSRVFCKIDVVQGYHQIPLDEDSSLLITFILPWGCFWYHCTGMGMSASSDEWCQQSDKAIERIPGSWLPRGGQDDRRAPAMSSSCLGQLLSFRHHDLPMETWGLHSSEVRRVLHLSRWCHSRPLSS